MQALPVLSPICCGPSTPPLAADEANALAEKFKALADPARVAIVNRLAAADEVCVCDLNAALELSQPTVSHHLRVLREAGLVQDTADGRRRVYTLVTAPLDDLAGWLGRLMRPSGWQHRLDALETEVYRTRRERHRAAGRHPSEKETA